MLRNATETSIIIWLGERPPAQETASTDSLDALNKQVVQLFVQGKYKEAAGIAEKALALAERVLGPEHPDTLTSVN